MAINASGPGPAQYTVRGGMDKENACGFGRSTRNESKKGGTPGPGQYLLPSDFGYLEGPKGSPRNHMSTQGSVRPRVVSRLQLSTLTGNVSHNLGEISIDQTGRDTGKSHVVKS